MRPSYFDAMEATGAGGMATMVEMAGLPNFAGAEGISTVVVQAKPNEYQP